MNWTFGYAMGAVALAFVAIQAAMAAPAKMTFAGLPSEQDRADVVAFLKENGK